MTQFQKAIEPIVAGKTYIVIPVMLSFDAPPEVWLIKTFMEDKYVCYISPSDEEKIPRILAGPRFERQTSGHNFYGPID